MNSTRVIFPSLIGKWTKVNLNTESLMVTDRKNPLINPRFCQSWVEGLHKRLDTKYSYGGWMEDRSHLWRQHYHDPAKMLHLGMDYNVPVGSPVHAAFDSEVIHIMNDKDQEGGWGGRVMVKSGDLYLIYGHLSQMNALPTVGTKLKKGDALGVVGQIEENGGWYPHLHLQCMTESAVKKYEKLEDIDGYGSPYSGIEMEIPSIEMVC